MRRDLAALVFALVYPTLMTWLYFVQLAGPGDEPNRIMLAAVGVGKVVQFIFPVAYLLCVDRSQLGWPQWHRIGLMPGIGFGLLTALAIFALYFGALRDLVLSSDTPAKVWEKLVEWHCATLFGYVGLAAVIAVVHSLLEEYYWRWFVFGQLRRHLGMWTSLVIASLGFMAHHIIVLGVYFPGRFWTLAIPFSLAVAVGGGVWCWLYENSRSLYAIWFSHLIVDAAILTVGYDMIARQLA